ncbi:MAG: hypothetical protein EOP06_10080 [Proteobacteria bacterium]|nr:MAG: hypothetical protein EOP06_10080 [Pseudomonadota bacterium]
MEENTSPKEKYIYTMTVGGYPGDVARFVAAVKSLSGYVESRVGKAGPDRDVEIDFAFEGRPDKKPLDRVG